MDNHTLKTILPELKAEARFFQLSKLEILLDEIGRSVTVETPRYSPKVRLPQTLRNLLLTEHPLLVCCA